MEPPQDALQYVRAVKTRFIRTSPQTYEQFLEVMRDFKNARSDTGEVVKRVKRLLGGHPDLLDGFNCFLPEPYKFSAEQRVKEEEEKVVDPNQPTIGGGYNLLKRIRAVYKHDERPYHAFLAILIRFRNADFTTEQVIKNVSTLFYDEPDLLKGKDGLEFFVPKNANPPKPSIWFDWSPQAHGRYGRTSFRVAVRMLLLCEKRSRTQPPDLSKKRVRVLGGLGDGKGGDGSSDEYSTSGSDSDTDSDEKGSKKKDGPRDPEEGAVDPSKIPPIWDGVFVRALSEFEKMTLDIKPMDDKECWEDALTQKEENKQNLEVLGRGKRPKPDSDSPPESPPPPNGAAPRSRKSARIIAKVNRGATYTSYKHLMSGRGSGDTKENTSGRGRGKRMSLTGGGRGGTLTGGVAAMSTLNETAPLCPDAKIVFERNPKEMSLLAPDRPGLHQLPVLAMERILFFLAQAEGKDELKAQREALMKSLGKAK